MHDIPNIDFDIRYCFDRTFNIRESFSLKRCGIDKIAYESRNSEIYILLNEILVDFPKIKI